MKKLKILCLAVPLILFGCTADTMMPSEQNKNNLDKSKFESVEASNNLSKSVSHEKKEAPIITTNKDVYSHFLPMTAAVWMTLLQKSVLVASWF